MNYKKLFHFLNPFAKNVCPKCFDEYEKTLDRCPKCQKENEDREFVDTFENMLPQTPFKELLLFALVFLGLSLISLCVKYLLQEIASASLEANGLSGASLNSGLLSFTSSSAYLAFNNFLSYTLIFAIILLVLGKNTLLRMWKKTTGTWKTLLGFAFGIALMAISVIWSIISTALGATTNENQSAINDIVLLYPVMSIIIFGFVGPFVEECAYRIGLFGFFRRINILLAYLLSGLIFGFIHMHDLSSLNEWLSFPSYLLSGIFLCFVYDKFGFGASFIAHALNNVISVLSIIASS